MPFSLSRIAMSPRLGQNATIIRSTGGAFVAGGFQVTSSNIPAYGVIAVADDEALEIVPEGERVTGALQFITAQVVYETLAAQNGISDKINWNGNVYRVQKVGPWKDFGFYSAILVRTTGD